ncbi:DUF2871 family protein [Corynebacterium poyangense]|uniref:DUF2871 family protein n=1 Tax=Corynebacterium poyangense TaxID=2684405 RepID=A0A7H0SN43_9CORY|nr:DUF2871 domain-containing protein [Corynebacterium poyangense]QNQ89968.1 DUF2871 family protein [Corynebacterium poyangense]
MKKLYWAACTYLGMGLLAGVFYREFTKIYTGDGGQTQLNILHTHLLTLGMMFFLICLGLDYAFSLSSHRQFTAWFVLHNIALGWTITFMLINGIVHATNHGDAWSAAWSGLAGVGHILLTISFIMFFVILHKRIKVTQRRSSTPHS